MRQGGLEAMVRDRPKAARWLMRRHLAVVEGTLGQAAPTDPPSLAVLLLQWLITQLRPDGEPSFDHLPAQAWADAAAWRPMITVASQCRALLVPRMPQVYRAKDGEPAAGTTGWHLGRGHEHDVPVPGARQAAHGATGDRTHAHGRAAVVTARIRGVQCHSPAWASARARARTNWHLSQAAWATRAGRPIAALWHACQAGQPAMPIKILLEHANTLAGEPETDALVHRVALMPLTSAESTELWLVRGLLARCAQRAGSRVASVRARSAFGDGG